MRNLVFYKIPGKGLFWIKEKSGTYVNSWRCIYYPSMDYIEKSFQSVAKAIQFFSTRYENLCFPMRHSSAYDLVGVNGKQIDLIKVMRTDSQTPSGSYIVNLRQSGGSSKVSYAKKPYDNERCDLIFIDSPDGTYLIPSEAIQQKRAISLSMFKEFIVIQ